MGNIVTTTHDPASNGLGTGQHGRCSKLRGQQAAAECNIVTTPLHRNSSTLMQHHPGHSHQQRPACRLRSSKLAVPKNKGSFMEGGRDSPSMAKGGGW
jgi:hypothetical protein